MATPPPLPNPLGNGAPDPLPTLPVDHAGVIPVRLVYTQPIPVRIVDGGGGFGKNPLGDDATKKVKGIFDKLPRELSGFFARGERYGRGAEGLAGKGTFGGAAAGLGVAAGAGALLAALGEVKSTFVDPFIGAVKGGFDQGVHKGAGLEVLTKSFEVLGVTVGSVLLPVTIRLAASGLALASTFNKISDSKLAKLLGTGGLDLYSEATGHKGEGNLTAVERIRERGLGLIEKYTPGGRAYGKYLNRTGLRPDVTGAKRAEESGLADVILSLKKSIAPPAQTFGVADVRSRVQEIALNRDPLEERIRQNMVKALEKFLNQTSGDISKVAQNTASNQP